MRVIGMILGKSGIGKSRACDMQIEKDPSTILVDVTSIGSDRDEVRDQLFKAAGVQRPRKEGGKKMMKMMAVLENKLRGTMRPVLIDDAHRLTRRSVQMFMDIHKNTRSPIIFAALPEFQEKIQTDDQWASRVRMRFVLKPQEDKDRKINEWRPLLDHMIDQLIKDVNGEKAALMNRFETLAHADGHFRTVESRLIMMRYLRQSPLNKDKSWCELFDDASEFLPDVITEN